MNFFNALQSLAQSEEGQIFIPLAEWKIKQLLTHDVVDPLIAAYDRAHPQAGESEMVESIDGSLWHETRQNIGPFSIAVDIARNVPTVDGPVRAFILSRLAALAAVQEETPQVVSPPAPDTTGPMHMETVTTGGSGNAIPLGQSQEGQP
jgi:hypothetical protein